MPSSPSGVGPTNPKAHPKPHPVSHSAYPSGFGLMRNIVAHEAHMFYRPDTQVFTLHWRGKEDARLRHAACGGMHTLFVINDEYGTVFSCGRGANGQLGYQGDIQVWTPAKVEGKENTVARLSNLLVSPLLPLMLKNAHCALWPYLHQASRSTRSRSPE